MTEYRETPLETKTVSDFETRDAHGALLSTFEAFKAANDERLADIEARLSADVLLEERVNRISAALDAKAARLEHLALRASRPGRGLAPEPQSETKAAFDGYLRRGDTSPLQRLASVDLEGKSLVSLAGSSASGYLAPPETEAAVARALAQISPIRAISGVRQVSAATYRLPFASAGAAAGWVGETAERTQTNAPVLQALEFPTAELYAMPAATQALLEDTAVDMDAWIADEVRTTFAEEEGKAFISGNGTAKPKGFLAYDTVLESAWAWGKIGVLRTEVAGDFPATNPSDILFDLIYTLKAGYRANAHFVMNRTTQAVIRKLRDGQGNYLWQPSLDATGRPMLMGFPVVEAEDMPDMDAATNPLAVAFGDFSRGYLVVDRMGLSILRDPYSAKPYVLFYVTKRTGGGVADFNAIKLLSFSVTPAQ